MKAVSCHRGRATGGAPGDCIPLCRAVQGSAALYPGGKTLSQKFGDDDSYDEFLRVLVVVVVSGS